MTSQESTADRIRQSPEAENDSLSDKLQREGSLLASIPSGFLGGVIDRGEQLITHPEQMQIEIATSFGIGAALTFLTRDPGMMGNVARFSPKIFAGLAVADIGRRFLGPMLDTWQHPNHLAEDKEKLANNVGSAAVDYPITAIGGLLGGAVAGGLTHFSVFDPATWRGASSGSAPDLGSHFWKFSLNAPMVYTMEQLPQGAYPSFPHQLKVPAVHTYANLSPDNPASVIPPTGVQLNDKHMTESFGIHLDTDQPVRLDLTMDGPGTDWSKPNDESAVLSIYVDGKYTSDLVLFGGSQKATYTTGLEDLPAGNHTITLRYAREKSTPDATGIDVDAATATAYNFKSEKQKLVDEYSPVLYGRNGIQNNHDDVPMGLFYTVGKSANGDQTIYYNFAYSNEDAGSTNPPADGTALLGRMTDIDDDLKVELNKNGHLISESFNSPGDRFIPFNGQHQGTHPVLRIENLDDMLADYGTDPLKFQYLPQYEPGGEPREEMQVQNPLWWQTMAKEIKREGKVDETGVGSGPVAGTLGMLELYFKESVLGYQPQMADPRDYLYVQLKVQNGSTASPMDVRAVLKNGTQIDSDLGNEQLAIAKSGWYQTALRLPPDATAKDVKKIEFIPLGNGQSSCVQVGHIFTLNQNYDPVEVSIPSQAQA